MSTCLKFVLLNCFFFFFGVNGEAKIKIERAEVEDVDKEYLNIDVKIRREGESTVIDIDADVIQEVDDDVFMELLIEKKEEDGYKTLYKSALINRCHFTENRDKYPIENALTEEMDKHGNLFQKCPVMKGHYYLKGFEFKPRGVIVKHITTGQYRMHFKMMKQQKKVMQPLFSIRWYALV